jgi:hypothetical protein
MRVALLCPGPSLSNWPVETFAEYDLRIAVNRAILKYQCEWWAAADWPMVKKNNPSFPVKLWTNPDTFTHLCGLRDLFANLELHSFFEAKGSVAESRWVGKTATAALVLAVRLGAKSIDVYGADWTDQPDFDGVMFDGTNRSAGRWEGERDVWDRLCNEFNGVTVTRRNG